MKNILLVSLFIISSFANAQVDTETEEDALTGEKTISTSFWNKFGKDEIGHSLSGYVFNRKDVTVIYLSYSGDLGCFSDRDTKASIKLDNGDIIEITYIGKVDCGGSLSGSFLPLTRDETKQDNYKKIIKDNVESLTSSPWAMIRLSGTEKYTDIYPSKNKKKRTNKTFFIDHIAAVSN